MCPGVLTLFQKGTMADEVFDKDNYDRLDAFHRRLEEERFW